MNQLPSAIFLMGPTASGKTGVAVELAQKLPVEIISVDSALVYRGMDIGTAKPDAATLARAPHHLIDIIAPTEAYSAAAFRKDALRLMADITARGKIPLLVGGTMLYFKALREGLSDLPQSDAAVRARLDAEIAEHGIEALHGKLAEVDPATAARLHRTDTQRIQRAMEVWLISGKPMSELIQNELCQRQSEVSSLRPNELCQRQSEVSSLRPNELCQRQSEVSSLRPKQAQDDLPYRILPLALIPSDRATLHRRIAARFGQMLEQGLVDELRGLRGQYPLHRDMASMRCVGYRQAWEYLEGEITLAELREQGIAATRQLAKRQLTWLRGMPDTIALDCLRSGLSAQVSAMIAKHLENVQKPCSGAGNSPAFTAPT